MKGFAESMEIHITEVLEGEASIVSDFIIQLIEWTAIFLLGVFMGLCL